VEGTVHLDARDPSKSTASVRAKVASVSTGQAQRDEHLRHSDFFEAETYPELTFESTSAEQVGDDTFRLTGDLTIKGVTRPVTVDFEFTGTAKDPFGNLRAGFEGRAEVNRKDWGLTYNAALETGGFMISDKIKLEIDVSAIRLDPTA
jgi:polyisoprenoid-binding protein YceI